MVVGDHCWGGFFSKAARSSPDSQRHTLLFFRSSSSKYNEKDGSNIIEEQSGKTNIQQQKWRFDESILTFVAATPLLAIVASGMK